MLNNHRVKPMSRMVKSPDTITFDFTRDMLGHFHLIPNHLPSLPTIANVSAFLYIITLEIDLKRSLRKKHILMEIKLSFPKTVMKKIYKNK